MIDFKNISHAHFIGAGGIGVSALVKFFLSKGIKVSASDHRSSEILLDLKARGAEIFVGHKKENVPNHVDLLIYSSAVPENNPERLLAKEKNIPSYQYAEALGMIMESYTGIAVSGTHGKTTTTSLLGKMFIEGGFDPLVVVGGKVPGFDGNLRLPVDTEENQNRFFIVEACEYRRNMLFLAPKMLVLTNIEPDHLDYYKDIEDIKAAFKDMVQKISVDGTLFYNADDENTFEISQYASCRKISYSLTKEADLVAKNVEPDPQDPFGQKFELVWYGKSLGSFSLPLPGKFNISNVLAAASCFLSVDGEMEALRKVISDFHGTWRRFQKMGECEGVPVYSDYAHHPTAVRKTIEAARSAFPNKKILTVFQPHQHNRTKMLYDEFLDAFIESDGILISEIYDVAGREEDDPSISGEELSEGIEKKTGKAVLFGKSLEVTEQMVREHIHEYDIVLIMGAGDIHQVAEHLVS